MHKFNLLGGGDRTRTDILTRVHPITSYPVALLHQIISLELTGKFRKNLVFA